MAMAMAAALVSTALSGIGRRMPRTARIPPCFRGQFIQPTGLSGKRRGMCAKAAEMQPPIDVEVTQNKQQPPASEAPVPHFNNEGKPLNFIAMGKSMQLTLGSQKDFDMLLEKCNAFGVMRIDEPATIRGKLNELDPKETWMVVDSRTLLKFTKKMALEEAEKNNTLDFAQSMLRDDDDDD